MIFSNNIIISSGIDGVLNSNIKINKSKIANRKFDNIDKIKASVCHKNVETINSSVVIPKII